MKSSRRYTRLGKLIAVAAVVTAGAFAGCNNSQGDTDGGTATDNLGTGNIPVSDGGFGAKLVLDIHDDDINVGDTVGFFVTVTDPRGQPLPFRRVFCESEHGIAILEPSKGGVAFEHTGADGRMSGRVGGLNIGSYLMECRVEEGFNLVDRKTMRIRGPIPDGFTGFPGAAGGNLGGGRIEPDDLTTKGVAVSPLSVSGVEFAGNCGGAAGYTVTVSNPTGLAGTITEVAYSVNGNESVAAVGVPLTAGATSFSGSFDSAAEGTAKVTVTATVKLESGETVLVQGAAPADFAALGGC